MIKTIDNLKKVTIIPIVVFCFLSLFIHQQGLYAKENVQGTKPLKIAHFYSDKDGFWYLSTSFAAAAAEDLNIEFDSYSYGESPIVQIELITKVLNDPKTRPDGFIFHNYKMRGGQVLEIADKLKIPAVMFNAGPTTKDTFGDPREKFPLYLGLVTPDDEKAGYDLTQHLISIAKEKNLRGKDGKIHLCIMEGSRFSNAAKLRKQGLLKALEEHDDVLVDQFFDTDWTKERAKKSFNVAVKRYPDAKVFWSASDWMTFGILEEAKTLGKKPGIDFITGGIDLLPSTQQKVLDKQMAVSIGAHYSESIWALLLLQDYLRGCDFVNKGEPAIFKSTMLSLLSNSKPILPGDTKEEILEWAKSIDFSKYSTCNSKKEYSFDAADLFNQ